MQWEVRSPRSPQTLIDTILLCHTGCMHGKEKLVCLFSDPSLLTFFENSFIEVKFTNLAIHLFKIYNSMGFGIYF